MRSDEMTVFQKVCTLESLLPEFTEYRDREFAMSLVGQFRAKGGYLSEKQVIWLDRMLRRAGEG